jgi:hypothetical protein
MIAAQAQSGSAALPFVYRENVDRIKNEFPTWVYRNLVAKIANGEIMVVELR